MYIDKPIKEYLDDLAAKIPAPGGGSAAALGAATALALMSMTANFTIGSLKYKDAEHEVKAILALSENLRKRSEELIDEDVAAYTRLSKAMKESAKDATKLDNAFKDAMKPPFEVCKITIEAMKACSRLAECGNKNLITDTAIAAIMLEGAFFSAKFNVYINLKYIKDMDFIGSVHKVLQPLEDRMPKMREEILEKCEGIISV